MSAHVTQWLSAYLDGEVAPGERLRLEEHLRECGECGGRLEQLAAVDAAARELQVEPPVGYLDSFSGRVRQRIEASRRPLRVPVWVLPLAAGLVIAVATPFLVVRQRSAAPAPAALDQPARARSDAAPPATTAPEPPRTQARALSEDAAAAPARPAPDKKALARSEPIVIDGDDRLTGQNAQEAAGAKVDQARRKEAPAAGYADAPPPPPPTVLRDSDRQAETQRTDRALESEEPRPAAAKPTTPPVPAEGAVAAGRLEKDERAQKSAAATGATSGADDARLGVRRVPAAAPSMGRAPATFEELRQSVMATIDEARLARERCRVFVRDHPTDPQREEARVLCIQMGGTVYGLSGDPADRETALAEARAYLDDKDAPQKARVRAVVDRLKR